ncbi:MAG: M48 family metalloprotease [Candidatus Eisenbacteria bacterium]|nr:M48 family metalloprotease [Candidatus Eisenbacteria bacterium]
MIRLTIAAVLLIGLGAFSGCATNPATGKKEVSFVSRDKEIEIGREEDKRILAQYGTYGDTTLTRHLDEVGQKLAAQSELPSLKWHFRLLDSDVVNAFALPGGYIYITRGIMAALNSEAQLAGIVGHEIGHVTARHTAQRITNQQLASVGLLAGMILSPDVARYGEALQTGAGLLLLKFGRDDENEADELGIRYMVRLGYDPREVPSTYDMLGRLSSSTGDAIPSFLSTHPDPGDRKSRTSTLAQKAVTGNTTSIWSVSADAYKNRLDGMVYGVDPEAGYLEANVFYHPGLNIELTWPNGWKVTNNAANVSATDGQSAIQLTMEDTGEGPSDPAAYVDYLKQKGEITNVVGKTRMINGQQAWVGRVTAKGPQGPGDFALAFIEKGEKQLYQLLGIPGATDANGRFQNVVTSLGPIRDATKRNARPDRIDLVTAPGGRSYDEIFSKEKDLALPLDKLAWLNNAFGKDVPAKGALVKVVRRG